MASISRRPTLSASARAASIRSSSSPCTCRLLFRNLAKQLAALDVELAVKRSRWELELGGRVLPQPRVDRSLLVGHEALASSVVTHRLRQLRQRSFDPVNGVLVRQQRPLIGDQGVAMQKRPEHWS
ncbi:MAG: hypothetical protein M3548_09760, partial [Actinomycetota bacterium]|nr:hypothetical protein [Actinomycetota bacterium]